MRAGCYLRVSTDDQDEQNQRADVEALCRARGFTPEWYVDHAKSGASTAGRTAYLSMMQDARKGRLKAVVVWKINRLGRKASTLLLDMDDLADVGVAVVSCRDPIDTMSAMGRAQVGIMAVFAQLEREQTVEAIGAAYRAKKARATNLGQKVRWGRLTVWQRAERDGSVNRLRAAVRAVEHGEMSERSAATAWGIPRGSLQSARRQAAENPLPAPEGLEPPVAAGGRLSVESQPLGGPNEIPDQSLGAQEAGDGAARRVAEALADARALRETLATGCPECRQGDCWGVCDNCPRCTKDDGRQR